MVKNIIVVSTVHTLVRKTRACARAHPPPPPPLTHTQAIELSSGVASNYQNLGPGNGENLDRFGDTTAKVFTGIALPVCDTSLTQCACLRVFCACRVRVSSLSACVRMCVCVRACVSVCVCVSVGVVGWWWWGW